MKKCLDCKEIKEYSFFSKNKNRIDGLQAYCESCTQTRNKISFQKCWALSNLQPLETIANMKKSDRIL